MNQEAVVKELRRLADKIEENGLRSSYWSAKYELIEVPTSDEWAAHRPGPRTQITLTLDWASVRPVDEDAGESSNWREW